MNEPLRLPVGITPGTHAYGGGEGQVAGHRVDRRGVRRTVVGHDPLHFHAERTVERDSPSKDR